MLGLSLRMQKKLESPPSSPGSGSSLRCHGLLVCDCGISWSYSLTILDLKCDHSLLYFYFFSPLTFPFTNQSQTISTDWVIQFTDQSQTISTDHSIHGPKSNYIHGPFHSQTIPFTDQRQTISTNHSIHGPFHSLTIYRLMSRTYNLQTNVTCPSNANNHRLNLHIYINCWFPAGNQTPHPIS